MAASPARVQVVRDVADDRIEDRVGDKRNHEREADTGFGKAEHLVVVEQQKERETVVLHAESDRAKPIEELRQPAGSSSFHARSRARSGRTSSHVARAEARSPGLNR